LATLAFEDEASKWWKGIDADTRLHIRWENFEEFITKK